MSEKKGRKKDQIDEHVNLLELLFNVLDEGLACFDVQGCIIKANSNFKKICRSEEVSGRHINDLLKEKLNFQTDILSHVLQGETKEFPHGEDKMAEKGTDYKICCGPLHLDDEITGGYIIISLIDLARKAGAGDEESNYRLRRLIDISTDGIAIINENHRVVESSQRFCDMIGYSKEEIVNLHTWDWEGTTTEEEIRDSFQDFDKVSACFETIHRRKDGTTYNAEVNVCGAIVEGEKYVICVTRDIGERKWAEEELRKSQAKFRSFVENASDIIFTVDQEGIITYISPNITTLAGYERAEVEGKHFFNLLHPGDYKLCKAFIEDVFQGKSVSSQIEYRVFYKDGTFKWHALKGSVDRGNENYPVFIGISRNTTEKKEYEEHLHYLSQHDQLTGLFNRIPLDRAMDRLEGGYEYPISFLMCDLNGLKEINDTYGHHQGDAILKATADVLRESLREEDLVARLGGDEFVVVLKKTDEEMCGQIVDRIRKQVEAYNSRCEKKYHIDLAIGSSTVLDDQKTLMKVFTEADDDMYREKRAKKGSCR